MPPRPAGNPRPIGRAGYALAAALPFAAIVTACLVWIARMDVPQYGVWTSIRPLETKIDLLEEFAKKGDVDALIIGSSIVDFGFSAEEFSRLMSRHLGRPYRAFNFATGGAEPHTLPILYRLARMVSHPKTVIVMMPPEPWLPLRYVAAPNRALAEAPIGTALEHPWLLPINREVYNTALLRNAPAVRDVFMWGDFHNLQRQVGMEAYHVDAHGDRIAYTFTWRPQDLDTDSLHNEKIVKPFTPGKAPDPVHQYFGDRDIRAMDELRAMVERDGAKLVLASHASASTWWRGTRRDAGYVEGRRQFFEAFAQRLGAPYWNVVDAPVTVSTYCIADSTHLNAIGAALYSRLLFDVATAGKPSARADCHADAADFATLQSSDPTMNLYSAVVERPAGKAHTLLWFRTVVSLAVPKLPVGEDMFVALRFPDGKDVVVPAIPAGGGDFVAEVDLPAVERPQALLLRLLIGGIDEKVALSNPVSAYEWIDGFPRVMPHPPAPAGKPDIVALPATRVAGDSLFVAMQGASPAGELRLVGAEPKLPAIALGPAPAEGALARFALPADMPGGQYAVELVQGTAVARSAPVHVVGRNERVEPPRVWSAREISLSARSVRVSWSGIRNPRLGDWIGLFPVHGNQSSRVDFFNVGPRDHGAVDHPLAERLKPALAKREYEFRLYADGGWRLLARSEPVRFVPGRAR